MMDIKQEENPASKNMWTMLSVAIFILILIIVLLSTGYMKKLMVFVNPDLESCKGGTCKGSCISGTEVLNTSAKCSDTSQVCCLPNTRQPSQECLGHKKGDVCGNIMMCDADLVCVTRCEYCAINPNDAACAVQSGAVLGRTITQFDSSFTCGCTEMDCNTFDNSKLGACITGFCPSNDPVATDYMCCTSPYKK